MTDEQPSKVVVTGASGYLGQHLTSLLTNRGYQVIALVPEPAKLIQAGVEASHYNLKSSAKLPEEIFKGALALVHAAVNVNDPSLSGQMEIEAAQRLIEQARRAGVQKLIFISSVVAKPDGSNRYSRVKWAIEQEFLSASGTIIRPGLIYGGSTDNNQGLFALLDKLVKASPLLPAFLPPLWVQPIHIDDLCETILNRLEKTENPAHVYEAAAEGVHLAAFLRQLAWHRHRKYPAMIPCPRFLIGFTAAVGRAVPLVSDYYAERLTGLKALFNRPSNGTLDYIGVNCRPLADGLSSSSRRVLLEEGRALGRYINGRVPGYSILNRYVRAVEKMASPGRGRSLGLAPLYLRCPTTLRFVDPKSSLCRLAPNLRDEMSRRLQFMGALSESDPRTAPKYHVRKPALLLFVLLDLSLRILVDVFLRGLGAIMRLGGRLLKTANGKENKHENI